MMRVKIESMKADLALNIKKTKIRSNYELHEFKNNGENVEAADQFIFLGTFINR